MQISETYLEDSWVLDIRITPSGVTFDLEVALTKNHPLWVKPDPADRYCYRRAQLRFVVVSNVTWLDRTELTATDATGEVDFGNIDHFEVNDSYELQGDWGKILIDTKIEPGVIFLDGQAIR